MDARMNNTLLTVHFTKGTMSVWHQTLMGNLADVFQIGNSFRAAEGKAPVMMASWIQRQDVTEYIDYLTAQLGTPAIERRKGKNGGTYAHLKIMIDAAASLSPQFKDEIYNTFITMNLAGIRDESGEAFKDLNEAFRTVADTVLGKPAHKGHYIQIAKHIRSCVEKKSGAALVDWNCASPYQLQTRARVEDNLATMLRLGVVRDWEHLKDLIEKV